MLETERLTDRQTDRQTEKEQRGGYGGREGGGKFFFLTSSKRWSQKRPKGEGKAAVRTKDLEVGAEGSFASKETKTKREKRREGGGWGGDARVGGEVQWQGHLPPQGSSGLRGRRGSAARTRGSRASSLQPREGVGDSGPRRFL